MMTPLSLKLNPTYFLLQINFRLVDIWLVLLLIFHCYFLQYNAGELGEKDLSCSDFKYVLHYSYHYLRNFICLKINVGTYSSQIVDLERKN